ncbi:hypothetical protein B1H10_06690 [candidate division KSB1 bacterium 4484_188]|nr:MAG: hypothetical protein B1H10_06690 [candidate division KSB1 bacterium 4484_188]
MQIFLFILYNLIFVPVIFVAIHIAALFHPKLRKGVLGRYRIYGKLRRSGILKEVKPVMVVHCASMGEFEHIKPFLVEFKKVKPDFRIIVLFFSPSGYENVRSFPAVDLFLYAPFDWFLPVAKFFSLVNPALWIVTKHDVWPNQVWISSFLRKPIFLINASLHQQSSRLLWFTRFFHREIYRYFTKILTISQSDQRNFLKLAPAGKVVVAGDTKYDQVIYRRNESMKRVLIDSNITVNRFVFLAGSTWPEDQEHLVQAVKTLQANHPGFLAIFCPHEPTEQHLSQLIAEIAPLKYILFSDLENYSGQPLIIVDRIGVLANLYSVSSVAYVGGSFRQNVHNVLEPAVYGIPVLFGPVNDNSHEAQLLKAEGGGIEVHNAIEIENTLNKFLLNEIYCREAGKKALKIVETNRGATRRTIEAILSYLP